MSTEMLILLSMTMRLTANGAVSVPLSVKEIHYRLYAIPGNHDFDWWWYTPDGREIHYRTNAPRGDLIDEEEVRSELYKMVAVSLDSSLVKPCPPLLMKELVESGSQGNVARDELVEDKIAEPIQRASNDLGDLVRSPIMIRIDGDELIVGASGPPVVEFGKLNLRETGFRKTDSVLRYGGWINNNQIWTQLTEFNSNDTTGRIVQTLFSRDGNVTIDSFQVSDQIKKLVKDLDLLNPSSWIRESE